MSIKFPDNEDPRNSCWKQAAVIWLRVIAIGVLLFVLLCLGGCAATRTASRSVASVRTAFKGLAIQAKVCTTKNGVRYCVGSDGRILNVEAEIDDEGFKK